MIIYGKNATILILLHTLLLFCKEQNTHFISIKGQIIGLIVICVTGSFFVVLAVSYRTYFNQSSIYYKAMKTTLKVLRKCCGFNN